MPKLLIFRGKKTDASSRLDGELREMPDGVEPTLSWQAGGPSVVLGAVGRRLVQGGQTPDNWTGGWLSGKDRARRGRTGAVDWPAFPWGWEAGSVVCVQRVGC